MSTIGQCKTDPTSGVSGAILAALLADTDNALIAAAATSGDPVRKLIAAQITAIVTGLLGAGIIGNVTITPGTSSVVATNSAITSSSIVLATIVGTTADATLTSIVRINPGSGTCTIYGNANATANVSVRYVVIN